MYEKYYKLSGIPFQLTPDSRFFFGSSGHSRAIAHLVYGLAQEEGFIVVTGEVGAGKTTLVEHLWSQLDRTNYVIARVVTTQVSGDDLLRLAVANFGVPDDDGADKATLLRRFERMARDQRAAGRRCLLVVDEVQNLSMAALEELRMLSNITVDGHASVQTILLGQPQFRATLANPDLEQLRQRVLASYHLGPLTEAETRVLHRAPAEMRRLERRSTLGGRRLHLHLSLHRWHPASGQHALLARAAVRRDRGSPHHNRPDGGDDRQRAEPGPRRRPCRAAGGRDDDVAGGVRVVPTIAWCGGSRRWSGLRRARNACSVA